MHLLPQFATRNQNIEPLLNTIHHCDAMDLLARLPDASVDMVLCDLPYGNGITDNKWDTVIPFAPMWLEIRRITKKTSPIVLTAIEPFASQLRFSAIDIFKYDLIWDKKVAGNFMIADIQPMQTHEMILVFGNGSINYYPQMTKRDKPIRGSGITATSNFSHKLIALGKHYEYKYPTSILHYPREVGRTVHPTQKPVALFEYLIKTYTQENEIVLDFTCGSGTTGVACMRTNRQFICGDITAEYVDIANRRLQETDPYQATELSNGQKQLSLFEEQTA